MDGIDANTDMSAGHTGIPALGITPAQESLTDPNITVGGLGAATTGGSVNADLAAVRSNYIVGITRQTGQNGKTLWNDGAFGCSSVFCPDSCGADICPEEARRPQCCNPQSQNASGVGACPTDSGWWNSDGSKGPCWGVRGAWAPSARNPQSILSPGSVTTCFFENNCTTADTGLCPVLGGVSCDSGMSDFLYTTPDVTLGNPGNGQPVQYGPRVYTWAQTGTLTPGYTKVACAYNLASILQAGVPAIEAFVSNFGLGTNSISNPDDLVNMMTTYSLTHLTNVVSVGSGGQLVNCPRMFAATSDGAYCRAWFAGLSAADQNTFVEGVAASYCAQNTGDSGCECLQRQQNPLYQAITASLCQNGAYDPNGSCPQSQSPGSFLNDGCWYAPCKDATSHFIPGSVTSLQGACPSNLCQQITEIVQGGSITVGGNLSEALNCSASTPAGGGSTDKLWTWIKANKWLVIGLAAGLGLLLIAVALLVAFVPRRKVSSQ